MTRQRKHFKTTTKALDVETFDELYSILRVTVCHGNYSQVAKILGVSRITAIRYTDNPPTQYWWNDVLTMLLNQVTDAMLASPNKVHRQYAHKARREMLPYIRRNNEDLIEYDPATNSEARRHILSLFKDHEQISSRQLRKAAFSGGYSQRTLREALKSLELDKETRGFGEDKVTYYRLPD